MVEEQNHVYEVAKTRPFVDSAHFPRFLGACQYEAIVSYLCAVAETCIRIQNSLETNTDSSNGNKAAFRLSTPYFAASPDKRTSDWKL
jgi:hypothetical protein